MHLAHCVMTGLLGFIGWNWVRFDRFGVNAHGIFRAAGGILCSSRASLVGIPNDAGSQSDAKFQLFERITRNLANHEIS
jgi:hypothetical protein